MNKLVINHLEKVFITSDAATIVSELEIEHPAAKMLGMAAAQQQSEIGDNSNLVVTLAGELLNQAKELLRMVRYRPKENTAYHIHTCRLTRLSCASRVYTLVRLLLVTRRPPWQPWSGWRRVSA